jgi:predicted ArsR family transcriptional regulator
MADELSLLQRVKAQAEVLSPLIKRLEAQLGRETAHELVREVLSAHFRDVARDYVKQSSGDRMAAFLHFGEVSAEGDAIEMRFLDSPPGRMDVDVVQCAYARFFRDLGEPELGFLLVCSADYPIAEELGVGLERTQTIMQGADHCDFKWLLEPATE